MELANHVVVEMRQAILGRETSASLLCYVVFSTRNAAFVDEEGFHHLHGGPEVSCDGAVSISQIMWM